jgi:UDPglucose 6-dehydrogenase
LLAPRRLLHLGLTQIENRQQPRPASPHEGRRDAMKRLSVTTISVVGLGKLGWPLAACLAGRGYRVIGADSNPSTVDAVNAGRAPMIEVGFARLVGTSRGRLLATWDTEAAVAESQVTFIVVPTPSTAEGGFSLAYVLEAAEAVGNALRRVRRDHLVVLTSTVSPGSTGGPVQAALEEASGGRCGTCFELCYSPWFVALGSVIQDVNPEVILIGESSRKAGDLLEAIYRRVCCGSPPVARMSFVNAELAKLALNALLGS